MKKIFSTPSIVLAGIIAMLPLLASAQHTRPSERRATEKDTKVNKEIFADDDPNFKLTAIPEKWNNASAVIINQKFEFSYTRESKGINYHEKIRRRVKLNDKAAVDEFSYFFYTKGENNSVGIKIIKPSGKVIDVSTGAGIEVEENIPDIFKAIYTYRDKYMKLAVPDLETGDIVDYYYYTDLSYSDEQALNRSFQDFRYVLASTYPIMNQELKFIVDRGFFINFASLNGAPELSAGAPTKDKAGRVRNIIKTYIIKDKDRDKVEKDRWCYTLRERPFIKFQVTYSSPKYADDNGEFLGEIDEPKTKITNDEVQEKIGKRLLQASDYTIYADDIMKYLKKSMPTENNPEKIARAAFYAFRYQVLNGYYNNPYNTSPKDKEVYVRPVTFVSTLMEIFDRKKIDYELAVAMDRDEGITDQMLFTDEVRLCLKVKAAKPFYMYRFNNFSTFDQTDPSLEGVEAIIFKPEKNSRKVKFSKAALPFSKPEQNVTNVTTDFSVSEPFENITIERKSSFTGDTKYGESLAALYNKDYLKEDTKKFDPSASRSQESHERTRSGQKEKTKKEDQNKENLEKANDYRKKQLEDDFNIVSYDEYQLLKDGRSDDNPALEYREKFTIKGIINKAGKNYLLDVGKIIGGQVEIKEDEVKRGTNIYYEYARTVNNTITITLPAGYTADGLNDLNMNVDNDAMAFKSTAKLEGGKIIITTSKVYKKAEDKKENWNKWVDALEAAYKFTQKKVVLKKA